LLRGHCQAEGRAYGTIDKTAQARFDPGGHGEHASQVIDHLHQISGLGIEVAHGTLIEAGSPGPLDLMAERVIPAAAKF
jgi:hypothetical protein